MLTKKKMMLFSASFLLSMLLLMSNIKKPEVRRRSRGLLDSEQEKDINKICLEGTKSVNNYYTTGVFPGKQTTLSNNGKEDEDVKIIIGLIEGTSQSSDVLKYVMKCLVWIAFIVIAILVIPGWIFCCCCCCCPCCCCKQSNKNEICCKFVSLIASLSMFGVVLGISIYGFFGINSLLTGFNGTSCAVMKMYVELIDGQAIETKPKWSGIVGIQETLDDLIQTVETISDKVDDVTTNKQSLSTKEAEHKTAIENAYTQIKDEKITFTNPKDKKSVSVSPTYVTGYGSYEESNTPLYYINTEYSYVLDAGKELVTQTSDAGKSIKDQAGGIETNINDVKEIVGGFEGSFDSFSNDIIDPWLDYQEKINYYGNLAFNCFFGVYLGFGAIIVTLTLLFVFLGIKILKLFIHISWNILLLVTIFTMIVGSIFGLVGNVGKTATGVMVYIISEENLNNKDGGVILTGDASKYLSTCIHGNGDLSSEFNLGSTGTDLDKLIELKEQLDNVAKTLEQNKQSTVCPKMTENYEKLKTNYMTATTAEKDSDNDFTKIIEYCNGKIESDVWVINKDYCGSVPYKSKAENPDTSHKYCLVFREWTPSEGKARYQDSEKANTAESCIQAFVEIETSNNAIIGKITTKNNELKEKYTQTVEVLEESVAKTKAIIDPVQNVFNNLLGENSSAFDIVNCKFLGNHVKLIVEELHVALGNNFYNFGVVVETMSSAAILGVIFLIPVLNRFHKTFDPPKNQSSAPGPDNGNNHQPTSSEDNMLNPKPVQVQRAKKSLEGGVIKMNLI